MSTPSSKDTANTGVPQLASSAIIWQSTITCPACGHARSEDMAADSCRWFYRCHGCATLIRPKPGDCCVFCSWGDVPCPPVQRRRARNQTKTA